MSVPGQFILARHWPVTTTGQALPWQRWGPDRPGPARQVLLADPDVFPGGAVVGSGWRMWMGKGS